MTVMHKANFKLGRKLPNFLTPMKGVEDKGLSWRICARNRFGIAETDCIVAFWYAEPDFIAAFWICFCVWEDASPPHLIKVKLRFPNMAKDIFVLLWQFIFYSPI